MQPPPDINPTLREALLDLLAREALRQFGQSDRAPDLATSKARIASNPDFSSSIARLVASEVAALEGQLSEVEKLLKIGARIREQLSSEERLAIDSQLVEIVARELPKSEDERLSDSELQKALISAIERGADPQQPGVNPYDLARRNHLATAARVLEALGLHALEPAPQGGAAVASDFELQTETCEAVTIDDRGEIVAREAREISHFEEDLGSGIKLVMVKVPAGTFWMGSPERERQRRPNEGPRHQVSLPEFYIGKYPITQAQWQALMSANPSKFLGDERRPVERVSWEDCQEFCRRLTALAANKNRHYRLPSEAEWEYACRAGTDTPFCFGDTLTTALANFNGLEPYSGNAGGEYLKKTTAVGQFPANQFGLCDAHGNVWERCQDEWHDSYAGAPTDGSIWRTGDSANHVIRGGSWFSLAWGCRSACRDAGDPGDRSYNVGLRLVCSASRTAS